MVQLRLTDFAYDRYSQFGDDGMIAHVLEKIEEESRFVVEFGAGDGKECSNSLALREQGWDALLMEVDTALYEKMLFNTQIEPFTQCVLARVTSELLDAEIGEHPVDVMSIDVDGDDWFIFSDMTSRPRLVVIEFNCSIPSTFNVRAANPGGRFGASALAITELAKVKGYSLIGVNHTNAYFVVDDLAHHFDGYETDLFSLMADRTYSTVVTDYSGKPVILTEDSFWWGFTGFKDPCEEPLVYG